MKIKSKKINDKNKIRTIKIRTNLDYKDNKSKDKIGLNYLK